MDPRPRGPGGPFPAGQLLPAQASVQLPCREGVMRVPGTLTAVFEAGWAGVPWARMGGWGLGGWWEGSRGRWGVTARRAPRVVPPAPAEPPHPSWPWRPQAEDRGLTESRGTCRPWQQGGEEGALVPALPPRGQLEAEGPAAWHEAGSCVSRQHLPGTEGGLLRAAEVTPGVQWGRSPCCPNPRPSQVQSLGPSTAAGHPTAQLRRPDTRGSRAPTLSAPSPTAIPATPTATTLAASGGCPRPWAGRPTAR